jgi:hypothetical protein
MSIEDRVEERVRAATRARAGLVRQVRPLELPDELPARGRRGRRARPTRDFRHWLNWGAPLAAAAVVIALAVVLVLLRQAPVPPSHPAAPTSTPSVPASVPRYYVVLASMDGVVGAVVADDRTGRKVTAVPPPHGQAFTGVTGAADDRTFVVSSYDNAKAEMTWYLLRIAPGGAFPAVLTPLPIAPLRAQVKGLALTQDGHTLAVMFDGSSGVQLSTYSVSSGALLGSWHTSTTYWILRADGANAYGLSWLADGRHIAFRFDAYAKNSTTHLVTVRTLDVAAAGHDLLANSRLDLQLPLSDTRPEPTEQCFSSLATPDGSSVICGTASVTVQAHSGCSGTPSSFDRYSTAAGQFLRALYLSSSCSGGAAVPLWTDASASQVIGLIQGTATAHGPGAPVLGLIMAENFTPFPDLGVNAELTEDLGSIAF